MKMFSETAQKILTFLQTNRHLDATASEIAEQLETPVRSVNGAITSLVKKGLITRVEINLDKEKVKFIRLTPEGEKVDPMVEKSE